MSSRAYAHLAPACNVFCAPGQAPNNRGWAWNLIHDHRVNENWADSWFAKHNSPVTPAGLENALSDHGNDLREFWFQTYLSLETVGRLFISNTPSAPQATDDLVHMLDLWSGNARQVWRYGRQLEIGNIATLGEFDPNGPPPLKLTGILNTGDCASQLPILQDFFLAWRQYLDEVRSGWRIPNKRQNLSPVWATLWKPWRQAVTDNPADWCNSVGLQKDYGAYVAVLKYSVSRARLLMPTQLEAGRFGRHFPVPPECPHCSGGRVVDGRAATAAPVPALPEFLHPPIPFSVDDWLASDLPVLRSGPVGGKESLARDREAHWERLVREFPQTADWMPQPNP